MLNLRFQLLLVGALAISSVCSASPVTYTDQVYATGYIQPDNFADTFFFPNSLVTITGTGDTSKVVGFPDDFSNEVSATVTVAGFGTASFYPFVEVAAAGYRLGFYEGPSAILTTWDVGLTNYDLRSAIQVSGYTYIEPDPEIRFDTDRGLFKITGLTNPSKFTASVATPEPQIWMLLLGGLLLVSFACGKGLTLAVRSPVHPGSPLG